MHVLADLHHFGFVDMKEKSTHNVKNGFIFSGHFPWQDTLEVSSYGCSTKH